MNAWQPFDSPQPLIWWKAKTKRGKSNFSFQQKDRGLWDLSPLSLENTAEITVGCRVSVINQRPEHKVIWALCSLPLVLLNKPWSTILGPNLQRWWMLTAATVLQVYKFPYDVHPQNLNRLERLSASWLGKKNLGVNCEIPVASLQVECRLEAVLNCGSCLSDNSICQGILPTSELGVFFSNNLCARVEK